MPIRFHKSFRIFPGVRLNVNGHSMSVTTGGKHVHVTENTRGQRTESVDLPGPFSWRRVSSRRRR
ncbi:DUF4236 domain-containing protein [Streptacidiphilus cavernicola]|uniref:DUF4236 domain-containing protein n=1 Tax=Streptacidiphilus cavernicola TaxID=3342716 RepID=A0ABV6VPT0_9ACTN